MKTLKEWVKEYLYEIPSSKWTNEMIIEAIEVDKCNLDRAIDDVIDRIETDDLIDVITDFDELNCLAMKATITEYRKTVIEYFKEDLEDVIAEIDEDIENEGMDEYQLNGFASEADYNQWRFG